MTTERMTTKQEKQTTGSGRYFIAAAVIFVIIVFLIPLAQRLIAEHRHAAALEKNRYHGFTFDEITDGNLRYWQTELTVNQQPYTMQFHYHPRDVDTILLEDGITDELIRHRPRELYLTFPPDASSTLILAGVEISKITGDRRGENGVLRIPTMGALQEAPQEGGASFPIITCANASQERVVIDFSAGTQNRIYRDRNPNCIIVEYTSPQDAVRVADRFSYELLQII